MEQKERNVLIVDDDPPILFILKSNLLRKGFGVREARNGVEALEALRNFRPDIIISDVMMPVMDGYEFCRKVREEMGLYYRNIPFIFLTVISDSHAVIKGFRHGADDYITKPFNIAEVLHRVDSLMDKIKLADARELDTTLSGSLTAMSLPDLLQILEVGRKTGRLTVTTPSGENSEIHVQDGFVVAAKADHYGGQDAVYHLLTINEGSFHYKAMDEVSPEMAPVPITHIMLEGMRIIDELAKINKLIPESDDSVVVNIDALKDLKNKVDDPEMLNILDIMDNGELMFSDVLNASPIGRIRMEVAAAKMIDMGILSVRKKKGDAILVHPAEGASLTIKYGVALIVGSGASAAWFLDTVVSGMSIQGVKKTKVPGIADFYILPQADGRSARFCAFRGERRFQPYWSDLLTKCSAVVYICANNDIDFAEDLESYLQLAGTKEKAVIVSATVEPKLISNIENIFKCKYFTFKNKKEIVDIFKAFFLAH